MTLLRILVADLDLPRLARGWVVHGEVQAESKPQSCTSKTASCNLLAQPRLRENLDDVRALPLEELEGIFESELHSDVIDLADVPVQLVVRYIVRLAIVEDLAGQKAPNLSLTMLSMQGPPGDVVLSLDTCLNVLAAMPGPIS